MLKGKQLSGPVDVVSWETVTPAERLLKEAKSEKPDLRGRKDLGLKMNEHFVSQEGTGLHGKQTASKSTMGS